MDQMELDNQNAQNFIKLISPENLFENNYKFDLVFNSDFYRNRSIKSK